MKSISVAAVGDVTPGFEPLDKGFEHVMQQLRTADARFAQSEHAYSERGAYQQQAGTARYAQRNPRMASAFKTVPFDVVSVASNHTGDWGPEGMEDTVDTFGKLGIATVGGGRTIAEARKPAF